MSEFVGIVGSRSYDGARLHLIRDYVERLSRDAIIVTGCATRGADAEAMRWGKYYGHVVVVVNANWRAHGKSAGMRRNPVIVEIRSILGWRVARHAQHDRACEATEEAVRGHLHATRRMLAMSVAIEIIGPRWEDPRELRAILRAEKAARIVRERRALVSKIFRAPKIQPWPAERRCGRCGLRGHDGRTCGERKGGA